MEAHRIALKRIPYIFHTLFLFVNFGTLFKDTIWKNVNDLTIMGIFKQNTIGNIQAAGKVQLQKLFR